MATKQKVEAECARLGITIEREYHGKQTEADLNPIGQLVAPDGFSFNGELHALTFMDWPDALQRLASERLTDCPVDCDCGAEVNP